MDSEMMYYHYAKFAHHDKTRIGRWVSNSINYVLGRLGS